MPTHRGFPVYPPQKVRALGKQSSFTLKSPSRAADREALAKLVPRADIGPDPTVDPFKWIWVAQRYLQSHSPGLGWHELEMERYLDGGSVAVVFGRRSLGRVQLVTVTFRGAGIVWSRGAREPGVPDDWGTIEYRFELLPAPALSAGFPLGPASSGCEAASRSTSGEGQIIKGTCRLRLPPDWFWRLPRLFGWTVLDDGGSQGTSHTYERRGRVVRLEHAWADEKLRLTYVFLSRERSRQTLAELRAPAARTAVIDAGCLVYDGRLVPHPYRFELHGDTITVNGLVLKKLEVAGQSRSRLLEGFDREVAWFRHYGVTIRSGAATELSQAGSDAAVTAFIVAVVQVVASRQTDEQKLERLRGIAQLRRLDRNQLLQIVRSWTAPPAGPTAPP